jgi:hypothetical protein
MLFLTWKRNEVAVGASVTLNFRNGIWQVGTEIF